MFWLGMMAGVILTITVIIGWSCFWISGREWDREMKRQEVFYPSAEEPELEPGEIAEWNTQGYWAIYKDGELVRYYPEWIENTV